MSRLICLFAILFGLFFVGGCGTSTYNDRFDDSLRELESSEKTPDDSDEGDEDSSDEAENSDEDSDLDDEDLDEAEEGPFEE